MLARRTEWSMRVTGVISIASGGYNAWTTYAATAAHTSPYAAGIAHADVVLSSAMQAAGANLSQQLALPRLLLSEPLIWLGLLLLLAPALLRRFEVRQGQSASAAYAGYSYLECPRCHEPVRFTQNTCPGCGASLHGLWGTEAGTPYLRRDPGRH